MQSTSTDRERNFRHSYTKDRPELLNRLSRIEGQVRGIRRLIGEDAYCLDVLQQVRYIWFCALRRRSQRRITWDAFGQLLTRFPLPTPRITHPCAT